MSKQDRSKAGAQPMVSIETMKRAQEKGSRSVEHFPLSVSEDVSSRCLVSKNMSGVCRQRRKSTTGGVDEMNVTAFPRCSPHDSSLDGTMLEWAWPGVGDGAFNTGDGWVPVQVEIEKNTCQYDVCRFFGQGERTAH